MCIYHFRCHSIDIDPRCSGNMATLVTSPAFCGIIIDLYGPFMECIESGLVNHRRYYQSCLMDVCAYQDQPDHIDGIKCKAVDSFSQECEDVGYKTMWRTEKFCRKY